MYKRQVIKKANTRTNKIKHEYVVTFQNSGLRYQVRALAKTLAGDRASGMRLHISGHLKPNFKALENLSYIMRQKFPNMRRNIKFDDASMDLMLDFLVDAGSSWRMVLPEQARKEVCGSPRDTNPANRSILVDDLSSLLGALPEAND